MSGPQRIDRLGLHNHLIFNNEIGEIFPDQLIPVIDWIGCFDGNLKAACGQFFCQSISIDGFKKAVSQTFRHGESTPDDLFGKRLQLRINPVECTPKLRQ